MSAQPLTRPSLVSRCLALWSRWSSSSSSSRSHSKGGTGTSKQSEVEKSGKEPKKPFEVPKTSGASAESKPPPPPPPEQPFDNSKYRVQELYQHGPMTFYDIECSLSPLRCPVPSSVKKPA